MPVTRKRVARNGFYAVLFLGFLFCFLFQVREQVIFNADLPFGFGCQLSFQVLKFLGKETVTLTRDEPETNLR